MSDITTTDNNDAANDMAPEPAVVKSIEISASTNDVWRAITEPDKIAQWMGGARVESKWELGSEITTTAKWPNSNVITGGIAAGWHLLKNVVPRKKRTSSMIGKKSRLAVMLIGLSLLLATDAGASGLKRMYALDCGRLIAKDQSRWTPGVNAGQPREFSNNCYLFQHERGTLLWETGVPDSVTEHKDGLTAPSGAIIWFRDKKLKDQLESLGVKPDDITYVAISHAHGDHIGNAKLFAKSKILMQKLDHEFAMNTAPKPLNDNQKVEMLSGDRDVFGDGSLTIISTPGHTPGRQSLLVKLPKTGALILTGDLVHFQYMWYNKVVPPFNFNKEQSLASIERIVKLVAKHKAQLWIGHDKDITAKIDRAPKFYE